MSFENHSFMIYHSGNNKKEIEIVENIVRKFNSTVGKNTKNSIVKTCWEKRNSQYRKKIDHYDGNLLLYDVGIFIFEGTFDDNINIEDIKKILKTSDKIYVFISENFIQTLNTSTYKDVFLESLKSKEDNICFKDYRNLQEFKLYFTSCISRYIYDSKKFSLEAGKYNTLNDIYFTLSQEEEEKTNISSKTDIIIGSVIDKEFSEDNFILKNAFNTLSKLEKDYKKDIDILIQKIKNSLLPYVEEKDDDREFKLFKKVNITKNIIDTIENYVEENNTVLNKDFFYIADLQESVSVSNFYGVTKLVSDYKADEKYIKIIELYTLIEDYNSYFDFLKRFKDITFLELYVENKGSSYDEDIEVKIELEKDSFIKLEDIPMPSNWIIPKFLKEDQFDKIFKIESNELEEVPLLKKNTVMSIEESLEILYKNYLADVFRYDYFVEENKEILSFKISYLKYNCRYIFPSRLFFKKQLDGIKYTISSKNTEVNIEKVLKKI